MGIVTILFISVMAKASSTFTDHDLDKLIKSLKNDSALIYTWSPHMVLSQKGLDELLKAGPQKPKRFIILLDPGANVELASKIVSANRWPASALIKNNSARLLKAGIRVHYPSYVLVQNDSIKNIIPGYKNLTHLQRLLKYTK